MFTKLYENYQNSIKIVFFYTRREERWDGWGTDRSLETYTNDRIEKKPEDLL